MEYLAVAVVTLHDAESEVYENAREKLAEIGLTHDILDDQGKADKLMHSTYAGKFQGQSSVAVRDDISDRLTGALEGIGVGADVLVFVGTDWSWRMKSIKKS